MRLTRTDRSVIAEWWFSVDRLAGRRRAADRWCWAACVSLAASPAVAHKIGEEPLYFFKRHLVFLAAGAALLIGASMLDPKLTRRAGLFLLPRRLRADAAGAGCRASRRTARCAG